MALATALAPAPQVERSAVPAPVLDPARAPSPAARLRVPTGRTKGGPVGVSHHPAARPAPAPAPAQLTCRGVVLCWVAAAVSVVVIAFGFGQGMQSATPALAGAQSVTVQSGESLWEVAQQVNPGVDPRVTVAAIRQANGLGSGAIVQPGTTLAVPVYAQGR